MTTLPGAWCYRVSARTGWSGVISKWKLFLILLLLLQSVPPPQILQPLQLLPQPLLPYLSGWAMSSLVSYHDQHHHHRRRRLYQYYSICQAGQCPAWSRTTTTTTTTTTAATSTTVPVRPGHVQIGLILPLPSPPLPPPPPLPIPPPPPTLPILRGTCQAGQCPAWSRTTTTTTTTHHYHHHHHHQYHHHHHYQYHHHRRLYQYYGTCQAGPCPAWSRTTTTITTITTTTTTTTTAVNSTKVPIRPGNAQLGLVLLPSPPPPPPAPPPPPLPVLRYLSGRAMSSLGLVVADHGGHDLFMLRGDDGQVLAQTAQSGQHGFLDQLLTQDCRFLVKGHCF